jgi:signal transduction histidine kinase
MKFSPNQQWIKDNLCMFTNYKELQMINQNLRVILEEHQKSHQLLQKLSQQVIGMLYQFKMSTEGHFSFPYASHGIKELFELDSEDLYMDIVKLTDRLHPDDLPKVMLSIEKSASNMEMWQAEYRIILPKKGLRYHFGQSMPERQNDGSIIWHGFVMDITESKNIEKFYHLQKLESIGRLTSGIAHDFNNLLMAISGYNDLNKYSAQDLTDHSVVSVNNIQSDLLENSKQIDIACNKAKKLISQMLSYCRRDQSEAIESPVLNVNNELHESLDMIRKMIPSTIHFDLDLTDKIISLPQLDESQFNQIIVNLCVNAADAIGNTQGKIKFHTGYVELSGVCSCCKREFEGQFIEISVSDSGSGISSDTLKHIFEPFYTTKGVGEGTGLGLSVIAGIVHNAEGYILLESEVDVGTTFRLLFPHHS